MQIHGFKTGHGTSLELALAATVASAVAMHYCGDKEDFFIAGHEHEELSRGAVSVAWEAGPYAWPGDFPETDRAKELAAREGIRFEALSSWCLAVYPQER